MAMEGIRAKLDGLETKNDVKVSVPPATEGVSQDAHSC